jgi:UDPglucose 6-dehydrogenase
MEDAFGSESWIYARSRIYPGLNELTLVSAPMEATEDADALVIVTEWKAFRSPDFEALKSKLKGAVLFDGRNLYEPQVVRDAGLTYYGIGRL